MPKQANTDTIIIFGSIIFVFLGCAIASIFLLSKRNIRDKNNKIRLIEKEKQFEILKATAKAEEAQKIRLASQIHDSILGTVNNASTNIASVVKKLELKGIDLDELKNELKFFPILKEGLTEIIHDIVPKLFTSFGLLKALEVQIKHLNKGISAIAEFHNNTSFSGDLPLTLDDQLLIYKICKELLNNLQKHSNYEYLNVSLEEVSDKVVVLFAHDGKPITNKEIKELLETSPGAGLKLLEGKLFLLGAELDYTSDKDASYIKLKVPLKKHEKRN